MKLMPNDPRILIEGCAELLGKGEWLTLRRLPITEVGLLVHPELVQMADMAAGVRLEFITDASQLAFEVEVTMPVGLSGDVAPFDVCVDGVRTHRQLIFGEATLRVTDLGSDPKRITVWLPHFGDTKLGAMTFTGAQFVEKPTSSRPHFLAYGSSITHCREALGPSETWPALVSANEDLRLTSLGFAGQCHLDPVVARHIRDTPADLISLCLGINVWGASTYPRRTLAPTIEGFLATVRSGHPDTPIVVISPIASPDREDRPNEDQLTLADIRTIVTDVVTELQRLGDAALFLIDGLDVLNVDEAHLLQDGLHPSPEGYKELARRLGPRLAAVLTAH
ncbi:hypothetical protein KPL76_04940 [Subtercola sp. PAMC28395]|uniref:GDSL-type esterase/lipase family protein n=1 Tax=Subtercola sp. PAMC28395 TaxID=2846775 RepID=UPI001C0AF3DE|nr:GDSL-type esterase/lipase family protein [Subtercola sp. PAMC28395]QWT24722.1 hypothetical protein KPL76_04940 [Subtercola sp. PAMC28395]